MLWTKVVTVTLSWIKFYTKTPKSIVIKLPQKTSIPTTSYKKENRYTFKLLKNRILRLWRSLQSTTALRTTGWPVVFVRKIPWTMVSSELREHFVQFGHARKCIVPFDKETSFHRGMDGLGTLFFSWKIHNVLQLENPITDGVKFHVEPQRKNVSQGDQTSDEDKDIWKYDCLFSKLKQNRILCSFIFWYRHYFFSLPFLHLLSVSYFVFQTTRFLRGENPQGKVWS